MTDALTDFASSQRISLRLTGPVERTDGLGNWPADARPADLPTHWRYELRTLATDAVVSGFYSQGSALTDRPTISDILESLALDADCYDNTVDVLDFAAEFGYDLDTDENIKRCRAIYKACKQTHADLTALLGFGGREALYHAWHVMNGAEDTM
jgi:hypothetical protein